MAAEVQLVRIDRLMLRLLDPCHQLFGLPVALVPSEDAAQVVKATTLVRIAQFCVRSLQMLVGCLVVTHQVLVVAAEEEDEDAQARRDRQQNNRNDLLARPPVTDLVVDHQLLRGFEGRVTDVFACADDREQYLQEKAPHEQDKVLVVAFAHACSDPRAVVVESLNAAAAGPTVHRARRPKDEATVAVLDFDHPVIYHIKVFVLPVHFLAHHVQLFLVHS